MLKYSRCIIIAIEVIYVAPFQLFLTVDDRRVNVYLTRLTTWYNYGIVLIPCQTLWSKGLTDEIFRANDEHKTPLHVAVEHGHVK